MPLDDQLEDVDLGPPEESAEAPAPEEASPLEKLMADKGISAERAVELLASATDDEARERAQAEEVQRSQDFEARYNDRLNREGGQFFANSLKDPAYAERALAHIRANHPHLVPQVAEEEDPDPVAALTRRHHSELERLKAENAQIKQSIQDDRVARQREAHQTAVAQNLERFLIRNPANQKFEAELIEELKDAYNDNPARFRNPAIDVPAFLKTKVARFSKFAGAPAPAPRKTTPPRAASGRLGTAPARTKLPDLSPTALAREAMSFMDGPAEGDED